MIIEYIRYTISDDRAESFQTAYQAASRALDASSHCLAYELAQGVEQPDHWILRIDWDSLEGHEQGFRSSPEFRSFFQAVRPFFDDIQEMKHYQETEVVSRSSAATGAAGRPSPRARSDCSGGYRVEAGEGHASARVALIGPLGIGPRRGSDPSSTELPARPPHGRRWRAGRAAARG